MDDPCFRAILHSMAEPFLGEIRLMSFNLPPKGWAFCNGQFLPINQNQALFALIGTTYGGNGQTTFALPELRGRVPIHEGSGRSLGETAGAESHTVSIAELPTHTHVLNATGLQGNSSNPRFGSAGHRFAGDPGNAYTGSAATLVALNPASVTNAGGSQAHLNMQPYLALTFCIALQGIFPSQN